MKVRRLVYECINGGALAETSNLHKYLCSLQLYTQLCAVSFLHRDTASCLSDARSSARCPYLVLAIIFMIALRYYSPAQFSRAPREMDRSRIGGEKQLKGESWFHSQLYLPSFEES